MLSITEVVRIFHLVLGQIRSKLWFSWQLAYNGEIIIFVYVHDTCNTLDFFIRFASSLQVMSTGIKYQMNLISDRRLWSYPPPPPLPPPTHTLSLSLKKLNVPVNNFSVMSGAIAYWVLTTTLAKLDQYYETCDEC